MMEDCSLQNEENESEYCKMQDDHMDDDDHGHGSPMQANLKYLMTSGFTMIGAALTYLRYRSDSTFYAGGDTYLSSNYWEQANMVRHPSRIAIFGILFILQALSMAGIAAEINMMAWHYLIPVWMLTNMVANVLELLAYDGLYSKYAEDTTNNAAALDLMQSVGFEQKSWLAKDTAMVMGLYFAKKGWMKAQWDMLPEEKQKEMKDKKNDADDDMDDMLLSYYYGI